MQSSSSPGNPWWQESAGASEPGTAPVWAATGQAATPSPPMAPSPPAAPSQPAAPSWRPAAPSAPAQAPQQWWERPKSAPGPPPSTPGAAPPPGLTSTGQLDISTLLHPTEASRLALALTVSLLVFGLVALAIVTSDGAGELFLLLLGLAALGGLIWLSLQVWRSRLLGGSVQVSQASLPELQAVFDQVRARLDYYEPVDVYVADKVEGGSVMTSYLGTRIIVMEGGLAAELLKEGQYAELTFLIGRHLGQLKARHQRLQWILIVISTIDSLKFLSYFIAPYYRATAKSGDQIAAACCGDIRATAWIMNRLLAGKELGPQLDIRGVLDQAVTVRSRVLPRLAQMFQYAPHTTNRYLNLLAFFSRTAPQQIEAWRATLDPATASRLVDVLNTANSRWW